MMAAGPAGGRSLVQHAWDLSPAEAIELQKKLRQPLLFTPAPRIPKTVAGADISYKRFSRNAVAGVVVLTFPDLRPVEESLVEGEMHFPYIPGLLSFREGPLWRRPSRVSVINLISRFSTVRGSRIRALSALPPIWASGSTSAPWAARRASCTEKESAHPNIEALGALCSLPAARRSGPGSGRDGASRRCMYLRATVSTWRRPSTAFWPCRRGTGYLNLFVWPIGAQTKSAAGWAFDPRYTRTGLRLRRRGNR